MCSRHRARERRWDTSEITAQRLACRSCSLRTGQPARGHTAIETGSKPRPVSSQSKGFGRGTWLLPESRGPGPRAHASNPQVRACHLPSLSSADGSCGDRGLLWAPSCTHCASTQSMCPGGLGPQPPGISREHCWHICSATSFSVQDPGEGWGESHVNSTWKCPPCSQRCSLPGTNTVF